MYVAENTHTHTHEHTFYFEHPYPLDLLTGPATQRRTYMDTNNQWRHQDLVPGGAHAKVTGFLQEATVDSRCQTLYRSKCTETKIKLL